MNKQELELLEEIAGFSSDPLNCARFSFPWMEEDSALERDKGPRAWQTDVLSDIGKHFSSTNRFKPYRLAVASGHGIGKSALISMIAHWAMSTCEDCRVVVTANTGQQLDTKTWPEMTKWFRLAINTHWFDIKKTSIAIREKEHEANWRIDAVTWSLENTEAFAGLHNKRKRIVVIFDEASSIPDKIWEVTEGALTDAETEILWIVFGNPTLNTGRFRECFGRYKHLWKRMQIDSRLVDGTNKKLFEEWVETYGEDSDFVRVRVRGEFPRAGSQQFIPSDLVEAARLRKVEGFENEWKILSCDVARFGSNQTVMGLRQGAKLKVLKRVRGWDTTQTALQLIALIKEHKPRLTIIDGDGVGGGVVDQVRMHLKVWFEQNKPCQLFEFHGGANARDGDMYYNQRVECWGAMRQWLETADIPDETELAEELTGPEYYFSPKGQIQLERKEDMEKRGLASPDIADMIAMSFAASPAPKTRDEKFRDELAATTDPWERHFKLLAATEKRNRERSGQKEYWM